MKIVTIVGARPQFVKLSPVSQKLRVDFEEIIINTGQHYDYNMAGIFFDELNIPKPDYNLEIGSGTHGKQTGEMISKIEQVLIEEKPDGVLIYGDTNSTLSGAVSASKLHIPIFHVEAGLRSYNRKMPEEINRVLTDHVSSILFAPTDTAIKNLDKEGIVNNVYNVGDVMLDATLNNIQIAENKHSIDKFSVKSEEYYLGTIHRAENTDNPERMRAILKALGEVNIDIILPMHPRTEKQIAAFGLDTELNNYKNVRIIPPVSYLDMLVLEKNAKGIITDSGGVQKEAYFMKKPCFTLRDETEWVETVNTGWNKLVNPLKTSLAKVITEYRDVDYQDHLYGDGKASEKIVGLIKNYFK